jgi:hypothetical protein
MHNQKGNLKMKEIKDHGVREEMPTGSVRDTQQGKPRPELIPPSVLVKLAMHYGQGSLKYSEWNWSKGQSISRYMASLERHLLAWKCGKTDESHLIAMVWNAFCIDYTLDAIKCGMLPKELDDRHECQKEGNPIGEMLYKEIEEGINQSIKKSSDILKETKEVEVKNATDLGDKKKEIVESEKAVHVLFEEGDEDLKVALYSAAGFYTRECDEINFFNISDNQDYLNLLGMIEILEIVGCPVVVMTKNVAVSFMTGNPVELAYYNKNEQLCNVFFGESGKTVVFSYHYDECDKHSLIYKNNSFSKKVTSPEQIKQALTLAKESKIKQLMLLNYNGERNKE